MVVLVGYLYDQLFLAVPRGPKLAFREYFREFKLLKPFGKGPVQYYPIFKYYRPAPGKPRTLVGERKSLSITIPSFVLTFTVFTSVSGLG